MTRTRTTLSMALLALLTAAILAPTQAQDEADPLAKAREFLRVSGRTGLGEYLLDVIDRQVAAQPGLPQGLMAMIRSLATEEELQRLDDEVAAVYARKLDADTLDAAIAFYSTPAGARLAEAQRGVDTEVQGLSDAWGRKIAMQAVMALQGGEGLGEARRAGNEAAAIGALKTISTAQALFREGDKDGNGELDYAGDLQALGDTQLIDSVLAGGSKQGYRFELCRGAAAKEFLWMAVASPIEPGETGARHFAVNHEGVVYYRTDGPFQLDRQECKIEGGTPVGR